MCNVVCVVWLVFDECVKYLVRIVLLVCRLWYGLNIVVLLSLYFVKLCLLICVRLML